MKNRANTLAAILGNMEDLEGAYESALNSEGSALKENEAYLDSIQGRIDLFKNSLQTMWMNFIDSSVIKFVVDLGTALIKAADSMGVLSTAAGAFTGIKSSLKSIKEEFKAIDADSSKVLNIFGSKKNINLDGLKDSIDEITEAQERNTDATIQGAEANQLEGQMSVFSAEANQQEAGSTNASTISKKVETGEITKNTAATWANVAATKALAVAKSLIKGALIGLAISAITSAIGKLINAASDAAKRMDELTDSALQSADAVEDTQDSIEDYKEEIRNLRKELDSNKLSESEAYESRQRLIEIQNELIDRFGGEANGINLVTGAIENQISAIDELSKKSADEWLNDNMEAYVNAQKTMKKQYDTSVKLNDALYTDAYKKAIEGPNTPNRDKEIEAFKKRSDFLENEFAKKVESLGGKYESDYLSNDFTGEIDRYLEFENKTAEEIDNIFTELMNYVREYSVQSGVDYSELLSALSKERKKYVDEDYLDAKELYDKGRQQQAISEYADEYGDILDAQEEIYTADTDEAKLKAIQKYNDAVKAGQDEAKRRDQDYMSDYFSDMGTKFEEQEFELKVKLDEDGLKTNLEDIIAEGGEKGLSTLDDIAIKDMVDRGLNVEGATDESGKYTEEQISGLIALQTEADNAGISIESLISILTNLGLIAGQPVAEAADTVEAVGQAYSTLASSVEQFASVNEILNEAIYDNIEISEEQYEILQNLIGSEEEFADCIDTTNGYVVKNTSLLRKLVAQKKKEQAADVKLAKSQARLEYYDLVKQLNNTLNGTKVLDSATKDVINTTFEQIDAVKLALYQYQLLEDSLLGLTNAFDEFAEAQEIDSMNTYGDSYVEMVQTMYDGLYKTGQVGTEAFWSAVEALVPDSVYQSLTEDADRMKAIYDYFNKNIIPSLQLEDDQFSMDYESIENFVDKALDKGVFKGNAENFDLVEGMNLEKAAELMDMTTTQAYAFFAELDKYNTSGTEQSFLAQLDDSLEGKITNITSEMEDLNKQKLALLEDGGYEKNKDAIDEINQKLQTNEVELNKLGQEAYTTWQSYTQNDAVIAALSEVEDKTAFLTKEGATNLGLEWDEVKGQTVQQALDNLLAKQLELEEPTILTAQLAIDNIDSQITALEETLKEPKVLAVEAKESGKTVEELRSEIEQKIQGLKEDKVTLATTFGIELSEDDKENLEEELNKIQEFTIDDKSFVVVVDGVSETMLALQQIQDYKVNDKSYTVTTYYQSVGDNTVHTPGSGGRYTMANGTAHSSGTAYTGGSWGAKKTETSLVGELGPEILVRDGKWTTIGENGAEFTQIKKGDIIFNHKQTEELLKNGYVIGRGKAYANGTSYGSNSLLNRMKRITESDKLDQLAKYAEEMCEQYEELTNGNVDLRKRPHLSPSYEHELAMDGGYNSFIGSDGVIYASTSAETWTIGKGENQYTIDITPVLENGETLTSDSLAEYINSLVTDGSMQDLLDSDKYNLIIHAIPGEYNEEDWSGFEDQLSEYKDGYLDTLLDMFNIGGEKALEAYGFSPVGIADVSRDLQGDGSYTGKEVASAIDDTSEGMRNLNELINQYVTDVLNAKSLANEIGTDLSKTEYGNVNTDTRQKLYWDEESIDKYSNALDSWGMNVDDLIGSYSTLLSMYDDFDGADIAFSPILQTEDGPQLLDSHTVYEYIRGLIDRVSKDGRQWTSEELFQLDTEGLEFNGTVVKNLLEDIGESASATSKLLHYVGDTGAISNLEGEIETTASALVTTGENISDVQAKLDLLNATNISDKTFTVTEVYQTVGSGRSEGVHIPGSGGRYTKYANGTVHVNGNAYSNGNFGASKTETALVGELGPEILVRNGRWTTVGDNGAEFTQVKKGDIIFNHKQTEDLLSKGYVTGRGKAYATGTAYAGLWKPTSPDESLSNKPGRDFSTAASSLDNAASNVSDAADEFKEVFDWIEIRLEEINKDLSFKSARLENTVGYSKQNAVINQMLDLNEKLYNNLIAGANKYYEYAGTLLAKIPAEYRQAAQDGSIAIETFVGEVDEETYNAIQEYREWVQKGDDAVQQAEEVITEVSSLAKQAIDNIATDFGNKNSLRDSKIDQLDAYNALTEAKYGSESEAIYKAIIKETNKNIKTLQTQRDKMQAELDKQVREGNIQKYSQDWYDAVNDIAAVDTEIINLTADTYDYQDSINELHWDHFDNLLGRLEAISDESDNLIDILSSKDLVDESGNWTREGITSLGLYAQKMEVAEMQAKKYKDEINYLNKNWKKLGYTEQEYVEKLEELKEGQYDSIKAYNDTKKAIVDLNKERIEAIKEGIEREIEAYEELINKKKEELDAEKDIHDFQKNVADQQKNIADIERKIAALSADNSASARAQRAKLEAELLEAQADLQETYYDRSITDQQNALDKELENFKENKDEEIEGWDEYLENTEQVVADSLSTVQTNTDVVYQTLKAMGKEYSLSIAESLTSPWKDGENAIQSFSEKFGLSMSSTVEELQKLADEYKKIMDEIANAGNEAIKQVNDNATRYQQAVNPSKPKFDNPETVVKPVTPSGGGSSSSQSSHAGAISGLSGYLQQGSTGSNVKTLQQALNDLGFNAGAVDGIFGYNTKQAVMRFQSSSSYGGAISADGIVGPNTKKKFKTAGYAKGTSGIKKNQLALIDELGEELQLVPDGNGRLAYLKKGTAIIPHDISENLMQLGQLNPQDILDRNRPTINAPYITNNNIELNVSFGEVVHIEHVDNDAVPNLAKTVEKQIDKYMKNLNGQIRKYTR